jgi:alpha-D-xyloside xylohydrolase
MKKTILFSLLIAACCDMNAQIQTNNGVQYLMSQPKDMSTDFCDLSNTYFFADSLAQYNASTGQGKVQWKRYRLAPRQAFNTNVYWPQRLRMLDFPETAYDNDPELKFSIQFVSPRTVRIKMLTTAIEPKNDDAQDIMLNGVPKTDNTWRMTQTAKSIVYSSEYGTIEIQKYPWRIILRDKKGKILTQTRTIGDNDSTQVKILPFNFIKRGSDNSRSINPVFSFAPEERIYGCGESFTSLNKAGQKVLLYVTDPQGPETEGQYKPVPFYFSNRGYGIFMHTSAPVTCDFGKTYIGTQNLYMGDENMDYFVFFGEPKEILNEYTDITGKSPMLPLWTFGTWMSRITYFSQKEGLDIAKNLRSHQIPADVIHFDTGWFGTDWQCDYQFAKDRFPNPVAMLKQMKEMGFHVDLWQVAIFHTEE